MEHDEVSHRVVGTRTLVSMDECICLLGVPREMLALLVELANGIVEILVVFYSSHLDGKVTERIVYLSIQVSDKNVLVLKTYVRIALAGMLICLLLVSILVCLGSVDALVVNVAEKLVNLVNVVTHLHLSVELIFKHAPLILVALALQHLVE